jgi:hypothetical protein
VLWELKRVMRESFLPRDAGARPRPPHDTRTPPARPVHPLHAANQPQQARVPLFHGHMQIHERTTPVALRAYTSCSADHSHHTARRPPVQSREALGAPGPLEPPYRAHRG